MAEGNQRLRLLVPALPQMLTCAKLAPRCVQWAYRKMFYPILKTRYSPNFTRTWPKRTLLSWHPGLQSTIDYITEIYLIGLQFRTVCFVQQCGFLNVPIRQQNSMVQKSQTFFTCFVPYYDTGPTPDRISFVDMDMDLFWEFRIPTVLLSPAINIVPIPASISDHQAKVIIPTSNVFKRIDFLTNWWASPVTRKSHTYDQSRAMIRGMNGKTHIQSMWGNQPNNFSCTSGDGKRPVHPLRQKIYMKG